eukprot:SM004709S16637  [mRNA]  locus=s4709:11:1048:- [translate_table: standard]
MFTARVAGPPLEAELRPVDYVETLAVIHEELEAGPAGDAPRLHLERALIFRGLGEAKLVRQSLARALQVRRCRSRRRRRLACSFCQRLRQSPPSRAVPWPSDDIAIAWSLQSAVGEHERLAYGALLRYERRDELLDDEDGWDPAAEDAAAAFCAPAVWEEGAATSRPAGAEGWGAGNDGLAKRSAQAPDLGGGNGSGAGAGTEVSGGGLCKGAAALPSGRWEGLTAPSLSRDAASATSLGLDGGHHAVLEDVAVAVPDVWGAAHAADLDVTLVISSEAVGCNRAAMAALSRPLHALLAGGFREAGMVSIQMDGHGLSVAGLRAVEHASRFGDFWPGTPAAALLEAL